MDLSTVFVQGQLEGFVCAVMNVCVLQKLLNSVPK